MNFYIENLKAIFTGSAFRGWGRKKTGKSAVFLARFFRRMFYLYEDGFIRSVGLGVEGAPSFSVVEDDRGIYYDATQPSRLEYLLETYDFASDEKLMHDAKRAMALIKQYKISKYNNGVLRLPAFLHEKKKRVLIIGQTAGDMSLRYGLAEETDAAEMIEHARRHYPGYEIYVKVHPDTITGKKTSNIDIALAERYGTVIDTDIHPVVLLEAFDVVYTQTSQMGFEALMLGKKVHIFGAPFYAGWQTEGLVWHLDAALKNEVAKRRTKPRSVEEIFAAAYILYSNYYNPYEKRRSDIFDTIETIERLRRIFRNDIASRRAYAFGFSGWKRGQIKRFLTEREVCFCRNLQHALKKGLHPESPVYIWGKKTFKEVEAHIERYGMKLFRVEDGFLRSVTLGSDLTKAYSLVIDSRGIYFDPTQPSDLEHMLECDTFSDEELKRARTLRKTIVAKRLSKYNVYDNTPLKLETDASRIIFVPGQVEDDASIIYGADGMRNIELLRAVRRNAPDAFIIYKPHPDVLAGNRKGHIPEEEALRYCDTIVTEVGIDAVMEVCNEVHTMTSLVGFEALLRGKKVYTYGLPFYAGWGLTHDAKSLSRRTRRLTLDELVAAVYLRYPRYIHPETGEACEVEAVLEALDKVKKRYNTDTFYRWRVNVRNAFMRKIQLLLKVVRGEWYRDRSE
jgi:capsular polysaccharide export protein